MKSTHIHIYGILAALLYWILDTVLHYTIFERGSGLMRALLPNDPNELWMRSIISVMTIGFGFYARRIILDTSRAANQVINILESTTDAYLSIDHDMNITYINRQGEQLLAVSRHNILGKKMWEVFPEAASTFYKQFNDSIKNRKSVIITGHYSAIGKWIEIHTHPSETGTAFYFRDVTERKLLDETNRKLKNIIGRASDGIITINHDGIIETVNDAIEVIFGYSREELLGRNISMLMNQHDADNHDTYVKNYLRTGVSRIIDVGPREVMAQRKDGSAFPLDLSVSEMEFGDTHYFIGIVRDITERWEARKQLQYLSNYDTLTDLPNRMLFQDRLSHALSNAKRQHHMLALMFIDLDRFKYINDTLGHAAGDQLLKIVARRLLDSIRESDTAARLSGDEFIVILEGIQDQHDATRIAEKILKAISTPMQLNGHSVIITSSIGISLYPDHAESMEVLLNLADHAMYRAKKSGKNAYRFFEPEKVTI